MLSRRQLFRSAVAASIAVTLGPFLPQETEHERLRRLIEEMCEKYRRGQRWAILPFPVKYEHIGVDWGSGKDETVFVLQRYNEALAVDYVVSFRLITPGA